MKHVREAADLLAERKPGKNWITRFLNRHPNISTKCTTPLQKKRKDAAPPKTIQDHFTKLGQVISAFDLQLGQIFKIDEKGFLLGLAQRSKVVCRHRKGSCIRQAEDGNRELITSIECVALDGDVLPPLIIYKGTNHYIGWHHFAKTEVGEADLRFSYSQKGWTNRTLGHF